MTAPTVTEPQLALARAAAEAALGVLPTSRELTAGPAVSATAGLLTDGQAVTAKFSGAAGLRQVLLAKSDLFAATVAEKLLTYALGRGVEYTDQPAVRAIVRDAARRDLRFTTGLIVGVVQSTPFQMKRYDGGTQP